MPPTNAFHDDLVDALVSRLQGLDSHEEKPVLQACTPGNRTRMVPFVGAGLSSLAPGSQMSWTDLVRTVATAAGHSPADSSKSSILLPEQLELTLSRIKSTASRERIVGAFDKNFRGKPAAIHRRLVQEYGFIATLNYDQLLERAARELKLDRASVDATAPTPASETYLHPSEQAIVHLHGAWPDLPGSPTPRDLDAHLELKKRLIFSGIDDDDARGPCLLLTDHQYHRLYFESHAFRKKLNILFSSSAFFLFLGVGLSTSEYALHHYLREARLAGGAARVGMYVGFDIDASKQSLLRHRGLIPFSLPTHYGASNRMREAVLHAFLDALHRFGSGESSPPDPSANSHVSVEPPTVLLAGISSRQHVLAIPEEPLPERSRTVGEDSYVEEAGGQHLYPALALAQAGHRVALASAVGDDEDGDWVMKKIAREVGPAAGNLDTQLVTRRHRTRRTFVLTYPTPSDPVHGWLREGVRQLMDLPEQTGPHDDWLKGDEAEQRRIRDRLELLRSARCLKALYLSAYGPDLQKMILETLGNEVPLRIFESGSSGGHDEGSRSRTARLAARCTHVVSSAAFVYWLAGNPSAPDQSSIVLQNGLKNDREALMRAHAKLFDTEKRLLVATLGLHGSAITDGISYQWIPMEKPAVPLGESMCWLGCGDTFRWAFLLGLLSVAVSEQHTLETAITAARRANAAALERTYRIRSLPDRPLAF